MPHGQPRLGCLGWVARGAWSYKPAGKGVVSVMHAKPSPPELLCIEALPEVHLRVCTVCYRRCCHTIPMIGMVGHS